MANQFTGVRASITPNTSSDNWTLAAGASIQVRLKECMFGGEVTTSTAMHTKVCRSSGQCGSITAGNSDILHPYTQTSRASFCSSFATTQPTLATAGIIDQSWNAHGGLWRWLADPTEDVILIGASTNLCFSCRNTVGTATSSYTVIWEEA